MITAGGDAKARVWRAADGEPVAVLSSPALDSAALSPDGSRAVTAGSDGQRAYLGRCKPQGTADAPSR